LRPLSERNAFARSSGDFWSFVFCRLRSTSASGVSFACTALMTSAILSLTSLLTSGTTFDARIRPFGSCSTTRSSVLMRGSEV